jgi:hypothetical protein
MATLSIPAMAAHPATLGRDAVREGRDHGERRLPAGAYFIEARVGSALPDRGRRGQRRFARVPMAR